MIRADPHRLEQAIWNLLSNAVKFTPAHGHVRVETAVNDGEIELVVSDNGEGIAPELLTQVFERFRQADASPTRSHAGLGIGLAIVRHIVELHGGTVRAESAGRGSGALFRVRLPHAQRRRWPTSVQAVSRRCRTRLHRVKLIDKTRPSSSGARRRADARLAEALAARSAPETGPPASKRRRGRPGEPLFEPLIPRRLLERVELQIRHRHQQQRQEQAERLPADHRHRDSRPAAVRRCRGPSRSG